MKKSRIAIAVACLTLSACSYIPHNSGDIRTENADYSAAGTLNARAYLYGKKTVLELPEEPTFLTIKDENDCDISYEETEGKYYRFNRQVDNFTVLADGHSVTFHAAEIARVFSAPVVDETKDETKTVFGTLPTALDLKSVSAANDDLAALIRLSHKQVAEERHLVTSTTKLNGADLFSVVSRLDNLDNQPKHNEATVQVHFNKGSTVFKPNAQTHFYLINAALVAERIAITGYTDSRIAGQLDERIAQGRALAAKNYLVEYGVNPEIINVAGISQGEFVAPYYTKQGAALNRRVEIVLQHSGLSELVNNTND